MTRHDTDPGIGIEHDHSKHCQRCIVAITEARKEINELYEDVSDLLEDVKELRNKRAKSEGRDEHRDTRARAIATGGVAVGVGAWIPQLVELIQKLTGG